MGHTIYMFFDENGIIGCAASHTSCLRPSLRYPDKETVHCSTRFTFICHLNCVPYQICVRKKRHKETKNYPKSDTKSGPPRRENSDSVWEVFTFLVRQFDGLGVASPTIVFVTNCIAFLGIEHEKGCFLFAFLPHMTLSGSRTCPKRAQLSPNTTQQMTKS